MKPHDSRKHNFITRGYDQRYGLWEPFLAVLAGAAIVIVTTCLFCALYYAEAVDNISFQTAMVILGVVCLAAFGLWLILRTW